jgi:hypothetical protein
MKKISLQTIHDKQPRTVLTHLNRYRIFLAWGVTNLFKNKKKAAIFQAALNAWVNDTFFELNNIYANLLYQYRRSWIFTSLDLDDRMTSKFRNVETTIHKLFRAEYRGLEGAFYAFESINTLCDDLQACSKELIKYFHDRKDWERIKEINLNVIQLKRILRELTETSDPGSIGEKLRRNE